MRSHIIGFLKIRKNVYELSLKSHLTGSYNLASNMFSSLSQSLHRSFLTGPLPLVPSALTETKRKGSSGRASPLVSAGEVLDKYFTLSKHHKDHPTAEHNTKAGKEHGVRQGAVLLPLLF